MVAGTFNLVIAQRLCRKACPHCSQKVNLSNHPMYLNNELISRGITAQQWNEFIKQGIVTVATGKDPQTGGICPHCGGSGYKGRVGIYELMDYTDDIKTLILDGKSAFEI